MKAVAHPLPPAEAARQADREAARAVRALRREGEHDAASERYAEIVERHQRRASRIAFHYLRDAADADDAVQDAFIRAFVNLDTYRDELPFEVWFTRILVNGCLDRIKARTRRSRWMVALEDHGPGGGREALDPPAAQPTPEAQALSAERRRQLSEALARLSERQRAVFVLSHEQGYSSREVSAMTGMKESTVRVHLFRAIRKLRTLLHGTLDG
ncbi:MAG: sigma-70 family RNA polymerase sigma factor [Acidobacteria bacterium]|nr:sigma-70 family RNA polymerase sigma factor [Acidobacteriota bacterium]